MKPNNRFLSVENQIPSSLRVVISGSSLFLNALAASLKQHALTLIPLSHETPTANILQHEPTVVLYQADKPPVSCAELLAADICCAELDPQYSQVTIHRRQHPTNAYTIDEVKELLSTLVKKE